MKIVKNRYIKLTKGEVRAIARNGFEVMKSGNPVEQIMAIQVLNDLVSPVDFTVQYMDQLKSACTRAGVVLDPCLASPRGARDMYRGLGEFQRHTLRRFRHGRIIREEGEKLGIDLRAIEGLDQIPTEPTAEIKELAARVREAENVKTRATRQARKSGEEIAIENVRKNPSKRAHMKAEYQAEVYRRDNARVQRENTTLREELASAVDIVDNVESDYKERIAVKDAELTRVHADNIKLSEENARLIEENRALRDRVQTVTIEAVADSAATIKRLEQKIKSLESKLDTRGRFNAVQSLKDQWGNRIFAKEKAV